MNAKNAKPFSENIHFLFRNIAYGDFYFVGIVMQYISKKTETIIVVRCLRIATKICNTPNNCPLKIIPKMKY